MDTKEEKYHVRVTFTHSPDVFNIDLKVNKQELTEVVTGAFKSDAEFIRFADTYLRASEIKSIQLKEFS